MESAIISTNAFETHMQKLKGFQEKHPKAFKVKSPVLPKSSFSLLSSNDRKELSTIYFNLAETIVPENDTMTEMMEENRLRALDYLNASISLDPGCNKGVYSMIAKIYAAINNHVPAYANALIAVESGEISRNDEFFVEQSKEIFPTPEDIIRNKRNLLILILFFFFSVNAVLILEPGTYRIRIPFGKRNIVIIGTALRPPPEGYAQKNFLMHFIDTNTKNKYSKK